jgi:hypothetical protein
MSGPSVRSSCSTRCIDSRSSIGYRAAARCSIVAPPVRARTRPPRSWGLSISSSGRCPGLRVRWDHRASRTAVAFTRLEAASMATTGSARAIDRTATPRAGRTWSLSVAGRSSHTSAMGPKLLRLNPLQRRSGICDGGHRRPTLDALRLAVSPSLRAEPHRPPSHLRTILICV